MIPQPGALTESTTIEFRITVELQPGDDPYDLEDHLTDQVCKFFGQAQCREEIDCPRQWVAGNSIVEPEPEEYSAEWMSRQSMLQHQREQQAMSG